MAAYCGEAQGNASTAALLAGYSKKAHGQIGYRLLKKAQIRLAIDQHAVKREDEAIADAAERDRILSKIARGSRSNLERIKAITELNKCGGRHLLKHEHSGPDGTPIQVVTGVPQPEQPGA